MIPLIHLAPQLRDPCANLISLPKRLTPHKVGTKELDIPTDAKTLKHHFTNNYTRMLIAILS